MTFFPCIDEYNQNINNGVSINYYRPYYNETKNMSTQDYNHFLNNPPPKVDYSNSYIGDVIFGRRAIDTSYIENYKYNNTNLFRGSCGGQESSSNSYSGSNVLSHWQVTYGN